MDLVELNEFFNYKNELMKVLCTTESIISLIDGGATAAYKNIFPFEFIPETVDNGETFICYDVDIINVENRTFLYPALYIWIFTHKSKLRLSEGGIRTDALAVEVNKVLNGSRYFGLGELYLKQVERFSPITDYQGQAAFVAEDSLCLQYGTIQRRTPQGYSRCS